MVIINNMPERFGSPKQPIDERLIADGSLIRLDVLQIGKMA
jgi:hypothetical protein